MFKIWEMKGGEIEIVKYVCIYLVLKCVSNEVLRNEMVEEVEVVVVSVFKVENECRVFLEVIIGRLKVKVRLRFVMVEVVMVVVVRFVCDE